MVSGKDVMLGNWAMALLSPSQRAATPRIPGGSTAMHGRRLGAAMGHEERFRRNGWPAGESGPLLLMIRRCRLWGQVPSTPSILHRTLCVPRKLTGSRCCLSAASTASPRLGSPEVCLGAVIGIGPRADFQSSQLTRLDHRGEPRPSEPL